MWRRRRLQKIESQALADRLAVHTAELARALAELERSEARLSEAQEVASVGSWEWDIAANEVTWTDELYRIYGIPLGTPVSYETYLQHLHPDDREMANAVVQRAYGDGQPFSFDHRIVGDDGLVSWMHGRGRVITDDEGKPVRMLGTGQIIDDRKQAEQAALALSEIRSRRHQAIEINDRIVQGLVVAQTALALGQRDLSEEALDKTMVAARGLITDLLVEATEEEGLRPGDLVLGEAAAARGPA